jgi:hypothetical protein
MTSLPFLSGGGEMGARMRAHDWFATPFGPPEMWPQPLRAAVSIMLNSRYPIALYWGAELALLYNDDWMPIPGAKHPWALGQPGREVWPEIWDTIGPLYARVLSTGEGVGQQDELLPCAGTVTSRSATTTLLSARFEVKTGPSTVSSTRLRDDRSGAFRTTTPHLESHG